MAIPRCCCAAAIVLLLLSACSREADPPPEPAQFPGATADERPESESASSPDFIGMNLESFPIEIKEVPAVHRGERHLITYGDNGQEIVAMETACGKAYYVFIFTDGKLASIHKTSYKLFATDSYEDLISGLSALPPMSTDEFRTDCAQEVQEFMEYREPLPETAQFIAGLVDDPVESGLEKWNALKISLGDDRDRVQRLFGVPTESRFERDETVVLYKNSPRARGGPYLEVSVWLKDDTVTRVRTSVRSDPG